MKERENNGERKADGGKGRERGIKEGREEGTWGGLEERVGGRRVTE
jgi:hypothetical protein